jgi:hypothetical protein
MADLDHPCGKCGLVDCRCHQEVTKQQYDEMFRRLQAAYRRQNECPLCSGREVRKP